MHTLLALLITAVALAGGTLPACANSILRNAAEAGVETVLEGPLPTATAARHTATPRPASGR